MAFKVSISDIITITVEGKLKDETGADKPIKFEMVCDRLTRDQIQAATADRAESIPAFFERITKDWKWKAPAQALVLDDDGQAAAYSVEALRAMFTIQGMDAICWVAYNAQAGVTAKN